MSECRFCTRDMLEAEGCSKRLIAGQGGAFEAVPYGEEADPFEQERCPDCGVEQGGFHHPGCDIEECPNCGSQLLAHIFFEDAGCPRLEDFVLHARADPHLGANGDGDDSDPRWS